MRRLALVLLALALPVQADVYKCRLADGRTEISNSPCAGGSGTVKVRPDDTVSAESREQAERDVARMRGFVDQREAEQRREQAAEEQRQSEERQAAAAERVYQADSLEACLAELGRQTLPAARRAELEAVCRAKANNAPAVVPVYGGYGHPIDGCIRNVTRQRLPAAEHDLRIARCHSGGAVPPPPQPPNRPVTKPLRPCPRDDRYCVR